MVDFLALHITSYRKFYKNQTRQAVVYRQLEHLTMFEVEEQRITRQEDEEPDEVEGIKIDKVLQICQNLGQDMEKIKKMITQYDDAYENEQTHLCVLGCLLSCIVIFYSVIYRFAQYFNSTKKNCTLNSQQFLIKKRIICLTS